MDTGYKMRTHISKSLQVRCKTLRKAIDGHNRAAAALDPPRAPIDWKTISSYQFLEQVELLRDTRDDLRDKRWANPGVRETIKLMNRIAHAREELDRLNLEVRRLHTAIRDDDNLYTQVIASLDCTNHLRGAVIDFATRQRRIDEQVLTRIYQIYSLPGFTGVRGPGVRLGGAVPTVVGTPGTAVSSTSRNANASATLDLQTRHAHQLNDGEDDEGDDIDDEGQEEAANLTEFMTSLALH